jgi:hypothetical protein
VNGVRSHWQQRDEGGHRGRQEHESQSATLARRRRSRHGSGPPFSRHRHPTRRAACCPSVRR